MTGPLPPSHPQVCALPLGFCVICSVLQSSDVNQAYVRHTFPPNSEIPYEFIFWRIPNMSSYEISPPSHPNTLLLHGTAQNLTGNGLTGTSTFLARRQQHVLFTTTVVLDFSPGVVGEEAGISVYLNQVQHFDFGVVSLEEGSRYIRLRTFTPDSTTGDLDPISSPGVAELPGMLGRLILKVEAVNVSTYEFSYAAEGNGDLWQVIGYGNSNEVSGGYTGVSRAFPLYKGMWFLISVMR